MTTKLERRRIVADIGRLLRSDGYRRVGGTDEAIWENPPGTIRVIYTYDQEADDQPVSCRIVREDSYVLAESSAADMIWLDEMLP